MLQKYCLIKVSILIGVVVKAILEDAVMKNKWLQSLNNIKIK